MKCVICKQGNTKPGLVTVTLERNGVTLVFKEVPAQVCENCGEEYLDEVTSRQLLENALTAEKQGVQVEVRNFKPTPSLV